MTRLLIATLALGALAATAPAQEPAAGTFAQRFGSGINLGNALEAPKEGGWGVTLQPEYFPVIADAGLRHVRIPVKWSAHADAAAPYTIDPAFFDRVDWAVKSATDAKLAVVLNIHHYDEIVKDPAGHRDRFLGLWRQIAPHYAGAPDTVAFELLNEPNDKLDAATWNALAAAALAIVRETNPTRTVVIGPAGWNNYRELPKLTLPPGDKHLVATFHYYDPFPFTHQGAEWVGDDAAKWMGTTWTGSEAELTELRGAFDAAQSWGKDHGVELYVGEFGAYSKADLASRVRWTRAVADEARTRGMASAYWEFCSGFGAYDAQKKQWREELKAALVGE